MDIRKCASELGKLGAAKRWAGKAKKPAKPRASKGKRGAQQAQEAVRSIAVSVRPVESGIATASPPWGRGTVPRAPAMKPPPTWGARKLLGPGQPATPPTAIRPSAPSGLVVEKPRKRAEGPILKGKDLTGLRLEAYRQQRFAGIAYPWQEFEKSGSNDLFRSDQRLVVGQRDRVAAVVQMCSTQLDPRFTRKGDSSAFWWTTAMFDAELSNEDVLPLRVVVEGSNALEHSRSIARAFKEASAVLNRYLLDNDIPASMKRGFTVDSFGPKDPQPGIDERAPEPSEDGRKRTVGSAMIRMAESKNPPPWWRRAYAQFAAELMHELYMVGYDVSAEIRGYKGDLESSGFETSAEAIGAYVAYSDNVATKYSGFDGSFGAPVSVRDFELSDRGQALASKPSRAPIVAKAATDAGGHEAGTLGLPQGVHDTIYQAFAVFGMSKERSGRIYSALATWYAAGGAFRVYIDAEWWETFADGDISRRNRHLGVTVGKPSGSRADSEVVYEGGAGGIEQLVIHTYFTDEQLRRSSTSDILGAGIILADAGLNDVVMRAQTDQSMQNRGVIWVGSFKSETSSGLRYGRLSIGYPKRIAAVLGKSIDWQPPNPPQVKKR